MQAFNQGPSGFQVYILQPNGCMVSFQTFGAAKDSSVSYSGGVEGQQFLLHLYLNSFSLHKEHLIIEAVFHLKNNVRWVLIIK